MTSATECFRQGGLLVFERGWLSSNNVLFVGDGSSESVLIDSGYTTHSEQTIDLVRHALQGRRLDRVINTHLHSDHCGGNHALQAIFGCAVDVPAAEAAKVDSWDMEQLTFEATGQSCPRFARSGVVQQGTRVRLGPLVWDVIAAPGHDPHSIALHQSDLRVLISADALWENGFGVVFPELEGIRAFDAVEACLAEFERLDIEWVIPGHGAPFTGVADAISRARRRLSVFQADPARHAWHAAKVLVKFHMLEVSSCSISELRGWMLSIPYLGAIWTRHFLAESLQACCDELLFELNAAGHLKIEGDTVSDN